MFLGYMFLEALDIFDTAMLPSTSQSKQSQR